MPIYFVRHQHQPDMCPAKDPVMGVALLRHLEDANAAKYAVRILGEAVLDRSHTLVMIAEAEDVSFLEDFMEPFRRAGSVEVVAASSCEAVVERHGCEPIRESTD